jgi:hypothetical protein
MVTPLRKRIFLSGVLLLGAAACAALAVLTTRRVKVEASHAAAVLVVKRTWPIVGDRSESWPLAGIRGTGLLSRVDGRGRSASAVTLLTDRGEVPISATFEAQGRELQKRAIDGFLADPAAPPLGLVYDRGNPAAFLALPALIALLLVVRVIWVRGE